MGDCAAQRSNQGRTEFVQFAAGPVAPGGPNPVLAETLLQAQFEQLAEQIADVAIVMSVCSCLWPNDSALDSRLTFVRRRLFFCRRGGAGSAAGRTLGERMLRMQDVHVLRHQVLPHRVWDRWSRAAAGDK